MSGTNNEWPCDEVARDLIRAKARQLAAAGRQRQDQADLEQHLTAALVERRPRYDPARGGWPGFVRVVIDHAAADLLRARRAKKRPPPGLPSLEALPDEQRERLTDGGRERSVDLALDTAGAVARLPPELRELAGLILEEGTVSGAARRLGVARSSLAAPLRRLRERFERAGLRDYL